MISTRRHKRGRLPILAAGIGLLSMLPAGAQTGPQQISPQPIWPPLQGAPVIEKSELPPVQDGAAQDSAAADADSADSADAGSKDAADIKDLKLDWSQLNVDASTLAAGQDSKVRQPKAAGGSEMSWSSSDKPDGASAVTVKQSLSTFLDTRVGADMTVVRQPQTLTEAQELSERLANGGNLPQSSGSAWATIAGPGVGSIWDKTAVEARLDPSQDQSKLGTSLSKSLALDAQHSLTLQNDYSLIEQGMVPVPGIIGHPSQNYQTGQSAKLTDAETGTSFTAGQSLSSTDDKWLRKIGAEQKLFGGVSISGSIGETPFGPSNKSLTAGYKQSW